MSEKRKRSFLVTLVKIAVLLALLPILAGLGFCAYGHSKPVGHTASGSELIHALPEEVFALEADIKKRPEWLELVKEVRDYKENEDGTASWLEVWNDGNEFDMKLSAIVPNKMLRLEIQDRNEVFNGSWTLEFEAVDGGTKVTITEQGNIPNAFVRGMFHVVASPDDTLKQHLQILKQEAEKRAPK